MQQCVKMIFSLKYMHLPVPFSLGLILGGILLLSLQDPLMEFVLGLPGIICHELAHFIVAFLLLADPRPINLVPQKDGDRWILGSVKFEPHWWSAGPAALAPLYVLPCIIYIIGHFAFKFTPAWQLAAGYCCATVVWGAIPSREDWSIAVKQPIGSLILVLLLILMFMSVFGGKV